VRSLNDVDGIPAIILVTSLVIATALLVNLWLEFRRRLGLSPKLSGPVGLGIAVVTVVTVFLNYEKVTTLLLNGLKYFA
jgi:Na+-transporting NADH:ubiquinone oxidoreductase subunit NqrE